MATRAATSNGSWARRRRSQGAPTKNRARSTKLVFHVDLPARASDGKAEKVVHKLHVILKNEW